MERKFTVYFGGTFDPPHLGHAQMLEVLARDERVGEVQLVPTSLNPLKSLSTTVPALAAVPAAKMPALAVSGPAAVPATAAEAARLRVKWIELWLANAAQALGPAAFAKIKLCRLEIDRADGAAFTVDTLAELRGGLDPENRRAWVLALGSDSLPFLEKWKNIDSLLVSLDSVWLFLRGPVEPGAALRSVPARLRAHCDWRVMNAVIDDVSSSEIRERLARREPTASLPVLPEIAASLANLG